MKKTIILTGALLSFNSAFAYSGSSYEIPGVILFIMVVYIIVSIIIFVRWWNMTSHIKEIKEHLTHNHANPKLTYLVAIGEIEQANKAALVMLVDNLMKIRDDEYCYTKAETMNKYLAGLLPKMEKLGLTLPDYVKSGEKFIDYINKITTTHTPYVVETEYSTQ